MQIIHYNKWYCNITDVCSVLYGFHCLLMFVSVLASGEHVILPLWEDDGNWCVSCVQGCGDVWRRVRPSLSCREFGRKTMWIFFDNSRKKVFHQKLNCWSDHLLHRQVTRAKFALVTPQVPNFWAFLCHNIMNAKMNTWYNPRVAEITTAKSPQNMPHLPLALDFMSQMIVLQAV